MLDKYEIMLVTKTLTRVESFDDDTLQTYCTHDDEGIIGIRIYDTDNNYRMIASEAFYEPLNEKQAIKEFERMIKQYESMKMDLTIIPLFATADEHGHYLDVSSELDEVREYLEKDSVAKSIIAGFGVFDQKTQMMPDGVKDFHYDFEEAMTELKSLSE